MDQFALHLINSFQGYGMAIYVLVTLAISAVLSFIIGLERELRGEPAGLSTHVLISISCSLLMTLSIWAIRVADGSISIIEGTIDVSLNYDSSRIAAAVVAGIGFLGAGAIVKQGWNVKGLSTAATLWISAAIGLACGAGFILEAVLCAGVTMLVLLFSERVKRIIDSKLPHLTVTINSSTPIIATIIRLANANNMVIREITSENKDNTDGIIDIHILFAFRTDEILLLDLGSSLMAEPDVIAVKCNGTDVKEKLK